MRSARLRGELRRARIGKVGRHIEQRLALIIEMRRQRQFRAHAPAPGAGGCNRSRHLPPASPRSAPRIPVCRTGKTSRIGATSIGVACRKTFCFSRPPRRRSIQNTVLRSSDSIRNPSCTCNSCVRRAKLKTSSGFDGRFSNSDPRRMQRLLQSQKLVAVFFQELAPVLEREASVARRQQSEEEQRPLAQALQRARQRCRTACDCAAARLRRRGTALRRADC